MAAGAAHRSATRRAGVLVAGLVVGLLGGALAVGVAGGPRAVIVAGHSMAPNLRPGDLVVVWPRDGYRRGDVVVYPVRVGDGGASALVVHRVVAAGADGYRTRGDNKAHADPWHPRDGDVLGRQVLRVPRAGLALAWARQPGVLAAGAAGLVTFAVAAGSRRSGEPSLHWELPDGTEQPVAGAYSGVV